MVSFKTPVYFAEAVFLDLISVPGKFMNNEQNAKWHLNYVCSRCSKWRMRFRDPDFEGRMCLWKERWESEDYGFSRDFGVFNWVRYYFGIKTNLCSYTESRQNSSI